MAQTLFSSYLHIVFSTKNRFNFISPEIEAELFAYIGGVVRNLNCVLLKAGGTGEPHSPARLAQQEHFGAQSDRRPLGSKQRA